MHLPDRILRAVRAPALALAVGGCAAAPAVEPAALAPEPGPPMEPVGVEPSNAADVAARAEAERLERLDRVLAAADRRRDGRVAALREQRAREAAISVSYSYSFSVVACGRA